MFRDYLGDVASGRLGRGRFILLWLISGIVLFLVLFAALLAFGLLGTAMARIGGDPGQPLFIDMAPLPLLVAMAVIVLGYLFANLNIVAKRARDIGLPGWLIAFGYALVYGATIQLGDQGTTIGAGLLIAIVLALVPGRRREADAP